MAEDGPKAVTKAQDSLPDAIVLDLILPQPDGPQAPYSDFRVFS
jgi:CheY-like chemotaxis protein